MLRYFGLTLLLATLANPAHRLIAQEVADLEKERLTTQRFLDVLLKRPRPGTALDRVYGYRVQAGTLDELLASIAGEKVAADNTADDLRGAAANRTRRRRDATLSPSDRFGPRPTAVSRVAGRVPASAETDRRSDGGLGGDRRAAT